MKIIHTLEDIGYKAGSLEELKEEIVRDCSMFGYTPEVTIEGLSKGEDRPENPRVRSALANHTLALAQGICKETDWWDDIDMCAGRLKAESSHGIEFRRDTTLPVLSKNALKYPVDKARGTSKKYNEL